MADRYNAFLVILDQDMREDDAQAIIDAIKQLRHVLEVQPQVANLSTTIAQTRVRQELLEKIFQCKELLGERYGIRGSKENGAPWCDTCKSWHSRGIPGCMASQEPAP